MFFETERQHFFRPLNGKRRELVVACLHSLYERLHGPGADYTHNLTRDDVRDILIPVVQLTSHDLSTDVLAVDDELASIESGDVLELSGAVFRSLLRDGWLEMYGDRAGLVTAYRFSRIGKLFAESLWVTDRPRTRSRQRNVRSCRNALEAALRNNDAYDLVDAYDYAEKVISDLSEGVNYFQELVRHIMIEATHSPWDDFIDFLDRFENEFKKQLTADSVERHRQAIRENLHKIQNITKEKATLIELQLNEIAHWAQEERKGNSTFNWILDRIEEMVEAACTTKQPELIKAMNVYMRQATNIVQQAMMLRGGQNRHAYSRAIKQTAKLDGIYQSQFLNRIGEAMSNSEIRLLDPATLKLRSFSQKRKALSVTIEPKVSRDARLIAALMRAEAAGFAVSNEDVLVVLHNELKLRGRPFLLSSLPILSARDVLQAMQAVEAVRGSRDKILTARKLPNKLVTEYYTGSDYQIESSHESN